MTSMKCAAVIMGVAACSAFPRNVRAQVTMVETVPRSTSTIPRAPFFMAAPDSQSAARLIGCYAITVGPWSKPQPQDSQIPVPTRVDLTADWHTRFFIGFRFVARTPGFSAESEKSPPAWSPIGRDSLQVRAWANGASSVMLFLRRRRDGELRGTVRYFAGAEVVDSTGRWMWETYPNAAVALRPTSCG